MVNTLWDRTFVQKDLVRVEKCIDRIITSKSYAKGGVTSCNSRGWWKASWLKKQLWKKPSGSCWTSIWMLLSSNKINCILSSVIKNVVSQIQWQDPSLVWHLWSAMSGFGIPILRDISILKWVRWRVMKMVKELEGVMDEVRLRSPFCLQLPEWMEEIDSYQKCTVTGWEAMDMSWNMRKKWFYHKGSQTFKLVALRICRISILGGVWDLTGHFPEQPVLLSPPYGPGGHMSLSI